VETVTATLRPDLAQAHERTWVAISSAGTWWSASERRALANAAISAMWSGDSEPSLGEGAPEVALRAAARLGSGRPHVTREWYEDVRDRIGALPYVELVGLVAVAAAASSLRRTLGLPDRELSTDDERGPSRIPSPELADAKWNWVPVAAPADKTAAVVQALTAVPGTFDELWSLADAQYIPDAEMVDPKWTRGTLSRVDMELLATRVSFSRECHY
jgi:hypothetical protein